MLEPIFFLIAGLILLIFGAEIFVRGASHIALRFGIPILVVGLTIVAFGTSTPELVTSLKAASEGFTDMAIGNNIGSNIANILLVLGIAALVKPFEIDPQLTKKDAPIALFASTLLVVFLADGSLVRWEGAVLFAGLLGYILHTGFSTNRKMKAGKLEEDFELDVEEAKSEVFWKPIVLLLGGLGGLVVGSDLFVGGASELALLMGVSEAVVGLTIMAIGTSLPEVFTVVAATLRGSSDLVTGNAVGSNIFNILCVLGLVAIVVPLSMGNITIVDLGVFWGIALFVTLRLFMPLAVTRIEGFLYLVGYVFYCWTRYGGFETWG